MFGHLLYETDIQYYMHSMHSHTLTLTLTDCFLSARVRLVLVKTNRQQIIEL